MPQVILGLDIGTYSVKLAELRRSFRSFELVNFYERRVQYNEVMSPEESTAAAVQAILEDNISQYDTIICALPGQHVSTRLISLPFGNIKKIDSAIKFEIEDQVPFPIDEIVFDYNITSATNKMSKVLVAYAQKGFFARYLTMLAGIGIDPRYVCVEGVELANLMNLGMSPPEGSYAIIDLGHSKTTVTICRGKHLMYTRTIGIAGRYFTERLQKDLSVPFDEAERLKVEVAQVALGGDEVIDDLSKRVSESLERSLEDILVHLKQTFFAYKDQEGEAVAGIYLSGGSSRLPGLDRYLSARLKQNVTHLDCLQFYFNRVESTEAHTSVIPQALSLALRGVTAGGVPDLNFRQGEFAYKGDVSRLGGSVKFISASAVLIIFLGLVYFGLQYYALNRKIAQVNKDVATIVSQALPDVSPASIRSAESALNTIKARKNEALEREQKLEGIIKFSALEILKEISQDLPPRQEFKVDVDKLSIAPARILISGRTTSFDAVHSMKTYFEKSAKFKNVTVGKMTKGVGDEIKFNITMESVLPGQEEKPAQPPARIKR